MSIGTWLMLFATLATAFAAATSLQRVMYVPVRQRVPRLLALAAGAAALGSMLHLFYIFLSTDLSYEIVHSYSSKDMPATYRLSGSWAGQAGSMVLWTAMILGFWMVEEVRWWRREAAGLTPTEQPEEQRERKGRQRKRKKTLSAKQADRRAKPPEGWLTLDLVRAVVMLVALAMLIATIALEPFAERTTALPDGGRGLNPVLRTPLMAIHPPIVFMSYAMLTLVLAAAMGHLVRRDPLWVDIARPWGRMAWLTLTLGIGIGAMWAYVTLGWGGYWAWDPVETSSLIPWIALTGFLHALHSHTRDRDSYRHMAPLLAGAALFLVFFATFVTRSGVWASVHSYAGSAAGSAGERVSEALEASASLRWLYYTMWAVLIATLGGVSYRYARAKEGSDHFPDPREGEPLWQWLARARVSMLATVILLSASTLLLLMVMVATADSSVSPSQYHARVGALAVPLMAFLVVCMSVRFLDRRRAAMLAGGSLLVGVLATAVNPGDLDPSIAWMGAALGGFGMVATGGHLARLLRGGRPSWPRLVRRSGSLLVHLGLAMVFMSYCLSNLPVLSESTGHSTGEDEGVEHDGYTALVTGRGWSRDTGVHERGEDWDTFTGQLELEHDGATVYEGDLEIVSSWKFREYGTLTYREGGQVRRLDGEVVASQLRGDSLVVRFQSFRDTSRSVVVDLFDPLVELDVWPALTNDADILEGELVRLGRGAETWQGFLVSVEGPGGNVTLQDLEGSEVTVASSQVERVYRKAYTGLVMTDVHIHRTPVMDVYVTLVSAKPSASGVYSATVMVSEVPAMSTLWTGMALMSIGVLLRPLEQFGKGVKKDADEVGGNGEDGADGPEAGAEVVEESEEDEG